MHPHQMHIVIFSCRLQIALSLSPSCLGNSKKCTFVFHLGRIIKLKDVAPGVLLQSRVEIHKFKKGKNSGIFCVKCKVALIVTALGVALAQFC